MIDEITYTGEPIEEPVEEIKTPQPMNVTEDVIAKCDKDRLLELLTLRKLPISQALAFHLISDMSYRPCDAARLLGISQIAVSDSFRKAKLKIEKN